MINASQTPDARKLLRDGWSDEDVERLTGLGLPGIVLLRAEAAAAAAARRSSAIADTPFGRPYRSGPAKGENACS